MPIRNFKPFKFPKANQPGKRDVQALHAALEKLRIPEHNPIERLRGEVHANVTRDHQCPDIDKLISRVDTFLESACPFPRSKPSLAFAA